MSRADVDAFLAQCDDVIDDWEGSVDAATWTADGSHERAELSGHYYADDYVTLCGCNWCQHAAAVAGEQSFLMTPPNFESVVRAAAEVDEQLTRWRAMRGMPARPVTVGGAARVFVGPVGAAPGDFVEMGTLMSMSFVEEDPQPPVATSYGGNLWDAARQEPVIGSAPPRNRAARREQGRAGTSAQRSSYGPAERRTGRHART